VGFTIPTDGHDEDKNCSAVSMPTATGTHSFVTEEALASLSSCTDALQVISDVKVNFTFPSGTATTLKYYRLDLFKEEEFVCSATADCSDIVLVLDGQELTCVRGSAATGTCQDLVQDFPVPAFAISVTTSDVSSITSASGSKFCGYCSDMLDSLFPVIFVRASTGLQLSNILSLYVLEETISSLDAKLVDVSLIEGAEGSAVSGCVETGGESSRDDKLSWFVEQNKVLPAGHVTDRWCVVQTGSCSLTAKYKLCVASGAKGVLLMDPPDSTATDTVGYIYIADGEDLGSMIPVVYSQYNAAFWTALTKNSTSDFSGVWHQPDDAGITVINQTNSQVTLTNGKTWSPATGTVSGNVVTLTEPSAAAGMTATLTWEVAGAKLTFSDGVTMVRRAMEISAGPHVGRKPKSGWGEPTTGGLRAYNTDTNTWKHHDSVFGGVNWVEHSNAREVLFACTATSDIVALDTSNPGSTLNELGRVSGHNACKRTSGYRDYHFVDVHLGSKYFTVLLDDDSGNLLQFYDTTDLADWKKIAEVNATWESSMGGIGQVVASADGSRLLLTWHCSLLYCSSGTRTTSQGVRAGERLYIMNMTKLLESATPAVMAVVALPMSRGSIVRDVACNDNNLCMVTLTYDGAVIVDINPGINRYQIISTISASTMEIDQANTLLSSYPYLRMNIGAHKVYAGVAASNNFFVERWRMTSPCTSTIGSCMRYDAMWTTQINYTRPTEHDEGTQTDSSSATLAFFRMSYSEVLAALSVTDAAGLAAVASIGLQDAMQISADRLNITSAGPIKNGVVPDASQGAQIEFTVLTSASGVTPLRLVEEMRQQVMTTSSAYHTGALSAVSGNSYLVSEVSTGDDDDDDDDDGGNQQQTTYSSSNAEAEEHKRKNLRPFVIIASVVVAIVVCCCSFCLIKFVCKKRDGSGGQTSNKVDEQSPEGNTNGNGSPPTLGNAATPTPGGGGGGTSPEAVIGRPLPHGEGGDGSAAVGGVAVPPDEGKGKLAPTAGRDGVSASSPPSTAAPVGGSPPSAAAAAGAASPPSTGSPQLFNNSPGSQTGVAQSLGGAVAEDVRTTSW